MSVIKLSEKNFDEVINNDKVLVDFYADWCGPCKMQSPIVDSIADEHPEIKVGKLNIDDEMDIAEKYGIVSIPTLLVFKNGQPVGKFVGLTRKEEILGAIE